jgi:hypothetical protein
MRAEAEELQGSPQDSHSARLGPLPDIRVRLVTRRAICGECMAACPVIPALRVSHRDIDSCVIEDNARIEAASVGGLYHSDL